VREFTQGNNRKFPTTDTVLDTTNTENDSKIKKEVEERKLQTMVIVHNFMEMWQGSQNL
jgi:hypothetical protein